MNAEIGIDEEGRAYIRLEPRGVGEDDLLRYMRAYLPLRFEETSNGVRITGDRLPGSGKAP